MLPNEAHWKRPSLLWDNTSPMLVVSHRRFGESSGDIFKDQKVLGLIYPWRWDRYFSQNIGKPSSSLRLATIQERDGLNYIAAETGNVAIYTANKAEDSAEMLVQMYKTERLNIVDYRNVITLTIEAAYSWKSLSPFATVMLSCTVKSRHVVTQIHKAGSAVPTDLSVCVFYSRKN